ncbi:MAG: hypothetical protein MKZ70_03020 [Opitutales bacterium]|nr:hypothetical protein [Opitutales bacterium]MCH2613651.1 hypothetical protein [Opitutales bacterium]
MNTQTKSNLIASIILALVPFGFLSLIAPSGDLLAGLAVTAALIGLAFMDFKQRAYSSFKRGTHPHFR